MLLADDDVAEFLEAPTEQVTLFDLAVRIKVAASLQTFFPAIFMSTKLISEIRNCVSH